VAPKNDSVRSQKIDTRLVNTLSSVTRLFSLFLSFCLSTVKLHYLISWKVVSVFISGKFVSIASRILRVLSNAIAFVDFVFICTLPFALYLGTIWTYAEMFLGKESTLMSSWQTCTMEAQELQVWPISYILVQFLSY
jgi:hypothetical protein